MRARPAGVVPIELWDLQMAHGILWDHINAETLPQALGEALDALRAGTATTRSGTVLPPSLRDFEAVWLAGGRAVTIDPETLGRTARCPVWIAEDPTWVCERGARQLRPGANTHGVIDLGQSQLKICLGGHRFAYPRPWDQLPLRDQAASDERAAAIALREFVVGGLVDAQRRAGTTASSVVVALPCELGDDPTPGGSSYAGLAGDDRFVPEVLASAGWPTEDVLVLNDAELAALAARGDPRTTGLRTLVLTLGFGVGGALLQRAGHRWGER
ncbi:MAG: hypothetical protein K0V04_33365 [Deltaproteobacteria bacterium]|nr:hypothetical protein [Deltaproteobacteria bacterium]